MTSPTSAAPRVVAARRLIVTSVAALLLSPVLAAPPASAAFEVPARPTLLPFLPPFDLEIDETHGYAFVTEGPQGNRVAVLDLQGDLIETLTVPGPAEAEVVGSTVYVASSTKDKIFAIDASLDPPAVVGSFTTGAADDPRYLAYAGGRLWIGTDFVGMFGKDLGSADPPVATDWFEDEVIPRSSPGAPNTLWAYYGGDLHRVDVTADPVVETTLIVGNHDRRSLVVDAAGKYVYMALGSYVRRLNADDLSYSLDLGSDTGRLALASNPDASVFVHDKVDYAIEVYDANGQLQRSLRQVSFVYDLAATSDGSRVFALTSTSGGAELQVLDPSRLLARVQVRFRRTPAIVTYGEHASIPIVVTGGEQGDVVTLYRVRKATLEHLGNFALDADGRVTASVRIRDPISIVVLFGGNEARGPAWSPEYDIQMAADLTGSMRRAYLHDGKWALYHARQTIWYLVTMKPALKNASLDARLQVLRNGSWRTASDWWYDVGPDGELLLYIQGGALPAGTRGRLSASWNGTSTLREAWTGWSYFRVTA